MVILLKIKRSDFFQWDSIPILVSCTVKTQKFKLLHFRNETCYSQDWKLRTMCFSGRGTHITRAMCLLGKGTHITRDMCFPGRGTHITRAICSPGRGTHITRAMCFPGRGTRITRDMCFPGRGTNITRAMCFPGREHILLGICVSWVGEHNYISLGQCVSQVAEQISLDICVFQVVTVAQTMSSDSKWLGFLPDICNADIQFTRLLFLKKLNSVLNKLVIGLEKECWCFGQPYPLSLLTIVYNNSPFIIRVSGLHYSLLCDLPSCLMR